MTLNTVAVQSFQFKRPNFVELNPILCPISAIETRAQILKLFSFYKFNFPQNLDLVTFDRLTHLGFFLSKTLGFQENPKFQTDKEFSSLCSMSMKFSVMPTEANKTVLINVDCVEHDCEGNCKHLKTISNRRIFHVHWFKGTVSRDC